MKQATALGAVLLQYPIILPTDYPMQVIRERVRVRGSRLDQLSGLIFKAYCVTEAGVDGAIVNQYAPFYYWDSSSAAGEFFWGGGGFGAIVADFGRPSVLSWLPAAATIGPTRADDVSHAQVITRRLRTGVDPVDAAGALVERVHARADDAEVHFAVGGINTTTWETVEFISTSNAAPVETDAVLFTVLHMSQPGE